MAERRDPMSDREKLSIGAVVFSNPAGRLDLTGGARVAMLVKVYRREDIGDVVCHADMYHEYRALAWDDIDWETSGIPAVASERPEGRRPW
jgi:hypothetical protein